MACRAIFLFIRSDMRASRESTFSIRFVGTALFFLLFCSFWALSFFAGGEQDVYPTNISLVATIIQQFVANYPTAGFLLSLIVTILNGSLLLFLNNRFSLIRSRTYLPLLVFLFLIGAWVNLHTLLAAHLALSFFILSFFFLFRMHRDMAAVEEAFMANFFVSIASLITPYFLFYLLFLLIAYFSFRAFSLRTVLASIVGVITPYIWYFSLFYFANGAFDISSMLAVFEPKIFSFSNLTTPEIILFSSLSLVFVVSNIKLFFDMQNNVVKTRKNLYIIQFCILISILLCVLFSDAVPYLLPLLALGFSFLVSYMLSLKTGIVQIILVGVVVVANIIYMLVQL